MVKIYEVEHGNRRKYTFTGTCVNSFDEDSMEYLNSDKIQDVNDLAVIDEEEISEENNVLSTDIHNLTGFIPKIENGAILIFLEDRDMYILYNPNEDVHYFYE